ncbi:N-acetylglucosamine-6-phosphate deacetylase [Fontisphaera persica]|uniref:N-acetylglucosamine-6-phosphate deacetylase n=1 Tax=Fontisphaera persica TaxID=2974023 RepID=UPI0024C0E18C|nr:N-acetylglucosamine-6-phosphate deacetylase [Fontisphaera persica]WCJ60813.1 N-acetylglucosamine-6-phosphate deacetylase [Fontisphaera persica]
MKNPRLFPTRGSVVARHYRRGVCWRLSWENGLITESECVKKGGHPELYLAPALFDPQVNGYAGIDFQQDGLSVEALLEAARRLRRDGCARFLLTLITDAWPALVRRLRHCVALRRSQPELQAAIAGWHIEGPFLSDKPGFCGAHHPALMLDPSPEMLAELRRLTEPDPLVVTLAPERAGSLTAIRKAAGMGIRVSLGHTDASARLLDAALAAGAVGFTHLANGCPRQLDRHDNILWRALSSSLARPAPPGVERYVGLIADGVHVSPALFRLLHQWLPPGRIYYTTDAMAAAAAPPGKYTLGQLQVEVGEDLVVRLPGTPYFAGSALRPILAVQRAAHMLQAPWAEAWLRASRVPAAFAGLKADLIPGQPANFCLVRLTHEGIPQIEQTYFHGKPCSP